MHDINIHASSNNLGGPSVLKKCKQRYITLCQHKQIETWTLSSFPLHTDYACMQWQE